MRTNYHYGILNRTLVIPNIKKTFEPITVIGNQNLFERIYCRLSSRRRIYYSFLSASTGFLSAALKLTQITVRIAIR